MKIKWHIETGDENSTIEVDVANLQEALWQARDAMENLEELMKLYNEKPLKTPFEKWVRKQRRHIAGSSVTQIRIWFEVIP